MQKLNLLLIILIVSLNTSAQNINSEKVATIDSIVRAPLEIISGEKGKLRDWETFRNLFTPNATFAFVQHDTLGNTRYRSFTLEEFVRVGRRGYENNGFLEYEIKKTVNEYNGIANVFQSYYAEGQKAEKGINSYQLMHDGNRWWITSILWTSDGNGVEIPENLEKE